MEVRGPRRRALVDYQCTVVDTNPYGDAQMHEVHRVVGQLLRVRGCPTRGVGLVVATNNLDKARDFAEACLQVACRSGDDCPQGAQGSQGAVTYILLQEVLSWDAPATEALLHQARTSPAVWVLCSVSSFFLRDDVGSVRVGQLLRAAWCSIVCPLEINWVTDLMPANTVLMTVWKYMRLQQTEDLWTLQRHLCLRPLQAEERQAVGSDTHFAVQDVATGELWGLHTRNGVLWDAAWSWARACWVAAAVVRVTSPPRVPVPVPV